MNAGLAEKPLPFVQHAFENVGLRTEGDIMFHLKGPERHPLSAPLRPLERHIWPHSKPLAMVWKRLSCCSKLQPTGAQISMIAGNVLPQTSLKGPSLVLALRACVELLAFSIPRSLTQYTLHLMSFVPTSCTATARVPPQICQCMASADFQCYFSDS